MQKKKHTHAYKELKNKVNYINYLQRKETEVMVESEDGAIYRRARQFFVKPYNKPLKSIAETEVQQKPQLDIGIATPGTPKRAIWLREKFNDFIMEKQN